MYNIIRYPFCENGIWQDVCEKPADILRGCQTLGDSTCYIHVDSHLADHNSQILLLRRKNCFQQVATDCGRHLFGTVKRPLSEENAVCLTPVAMALNENIEVLSMDVVNGIVRIPIQVNLHCKKPNVVQYINQLLELE